MTAPPADTSTAGKLKGFWLIVLIPSRGTTRRPATNAPTIPTMISSTMPSRFPVYELANLPTIAPTPSHIIKFILFPLSLKNTDQSYLLSRHVLRITDLGSQKHQRNSDNNVGFRLIRLSVFVLRGSRGDEGCPMIFISAIDLKGQPKPRSSPALTASCKCPALYSILFLGHFGSARCPGRIGLTGRLLQAPHVGASPFRQSFRFSLACLVCHQYQLLYPCQL